MLTNGFALLRGEDAPSATREAIDRVERFSKHVLVDAGDGFGDYREAKLSGKKEIALAYSLAKPDGGPLVHGYTQEGWEGETTGTMPNGEFSLLARRDRESFAGARDALGTRGLWIVGDGQGASMASDHRLLKGTPRLVEPGWVSDGKRAWRWEDGAPRDRPPGSFESAARDLAVLIEESVGERVRGRRHVAVSFSGGLDSSLLALVASRHTDVLLCSAYSADSLDEEKTETAAQVLGLRLETAVLDDKVVEKKLGALGLLPGETTLMDKALWCIYSSTSELAGKNGAEMILLGQLADELFGGYRKYTLKAREEGVKAAEAMMAQDVRACGTWGFLRDEAACSRFAEARFPYADRRIASFASALPFDYKVRGEERKAVLRAAAIELGLPEELAMAPKKAAQFSSGTSKLLKRLTGF